MAEDEGALAHLHVFAEAELPASHVAALVRVAGDSAADGLTFAVAEPVVQAPHDTAGLDEAYQSLIDHLRPRWGTVSFPIAEAPQEALLATVEPSGDVPVKYFDTSIAFKLSATRPGADVLMLTAGPGRTLEGYLDVASVLRQLGYDVRVSAP